ncbi:hypothetical protein OF83DRAFT_1169917 [Amylostereum chailletii]|nr:hypothetical protein OF83DRAFT_1169917 [Amylostereum chailletii]
MQFTQKLTLLAALVASAVAIERPKGGPDGLYIAEVDANGDEKLTYVGPGNTTVPHTLTARASTGPFCQSVQASASDISNAEHALANFFGGGTSFFGSSVSMYSGSAVAYGCNYGNGQTMSSQEFLGYVSVLDAKCGGQNAAYYNLPSSKSSYGRTASSQGFC